ncbi:hypothetical protein BJ878DRAFT_33999 [Calycina marina]|uniref:Uncharacterized protein n=1 Tax=Calycina marina TaxID=1763456 RepID=A0A9P7Z403_9HELO|nr:hypothetical protein BJ878DRAFT_33999 [Calycina marina]
MKLSQRKMERLWLLSFLLGSNPTLVTGDFWWFIVKKTKTIGAVTEWIQKKEGVLVNLTTSGTPLSQNIQVGGLNGRDEGFVVL